MRNVLLYSLCFNKYFLDVQKERLTLYTIHLPNVFIITLEEEVVIPILIVAVDVNNEWFHGLMDIV